MTRMWRISSGAQDHIPRVLLTEPSGLLVALQSRVDVALQQQRDALLRDWLAARAGVDASRVQVWRAANGAPRANVDGQPVEVSTSHRAGCLLMGAANEPIGVDLESVGIPQPPPWNVLASDERAALEAIPDDAARHEAFLAMWTLKESFLKARGTGFSGDPAALAVEWSDSCAPILRERSAIAPTRLAMTGTAIVGSERFVFACVVL